MLVHRKGSSKVAAREEMRAQASRNSPVGRKVQAEERVEKKLLTLKSLMKSKLRWSRIF